MTKLNLWFLCGVNIYIPLPPQHTDSWANSGDAEVMLYYLQA